MAKNKSGKSAVYKAESSPINVSEKLLLLLETALRYFFPAAVNIGSLLKPFLVFLCMASWSGVLLSQEIKPFTSDGCSAFPDGTYSHNELWLQCCTAHDYAYWKGGTHQQREDADRALELCVAEIGEGSVAFVMHAGVRVGGVPYLPTPFRWGYGWPYPKEYGELTADELAKVEKASNPEVMRGKKSQQKSH
mgnify:CR=1 FL=1